jgi:hypothetical protein
LHSFWRERQTIANSYETGKAKQKTISLASHYTAVMMMMIMMIIIIIIIIINIKYP